MQPTFSNNGTAELSLPGRYDNLLLGGRHCGNCANKHPLTQQTARKRLPPSSPGSSVPLTSERCNNFPLGDRTDEHYVGKLQLMQQTAGMPSTQSNVGFFVTIVFHPKAKVTWIST
mmetsp:Transcript_2300/g.4949  ORF Transcript_2300/g.4949 Transcript_2300/m.4949 type:complete len:116 (+) Transcript_2300:2374-2721(+)